MRLEELTVALRPRQPWEAVDLGCALTRRDYGRILALWAATVVPVWLVLGICLWDSPAVFSLVVWWLKPLYDRVPLHFISRAAFGVKPGFVETWKQWPRLWSRFLFSALIWRRLSFMRSFAMPVLMLEGQRGRAAFQRVKALATDGGSSGSSVTWVFLNLEFVVCVGLYSLTSGLAPETGIPNLLEMIDGADMPSHVSLAFQWYLNVIYMLAVTVIEPFYVGAGFALYLNSRTHLEGWDIELTFRKLAARLRPVLVLLMLGLLTSFSVPGSAMAITVTDGVKKVPAKVEADPAAQAIHKILEHPDFKVHSRTQKTWVPDETEEVGGEVSSLMAMIFYALLWLIVAGLIGFVIYLLFANRHLLNRGFRLRAPSLPKRQGPRIVMGMDIGRESLPDDIVKAAQSAWRAGHLREALSLLYRGSLSRLVEQRHLPIRDSDTEDDCLTHVLRSGAPEAESKYFSGLSRLWIRAAYAGEEASQGDFDQVCLSWPFDGAAGQAVRPGVSRTVVLLLPLLAMLTGCKGHWEDVERKLGYKGQARTDCFLAARQLIEEFDIEAERRAVLDKMPEDDMGVLVLSAENVVSAARSEQILKWVNDGGHLIYPMAGCGAYNDWGIFSAMSGYAYFGNDTRPDNILRELGVTVHDRRAEEMKKLMKKSGFKKAEKTDEANKTDEATEEPKKKESKKKKQGIKDPDDVPTGLFEMSWDGEIYKIEVPDFVTFKYDHELRAGDYAGGTKNKTFILSLAHGLGRVTLLNHARPLRNRYIGERDHARWLMALVGLDAERVEFVIGMEKSFMEMLWEHGWMLIISLAVGVAFWLWCHMPRFGPIRQAVLHETRHFVDHVAALGQFFHRLHRDDVLLRDAALQVRARALTRFPQLTGAGDAVLLPHLSQVSGLKLDRVQAALAEPRALAPYQFVAVLQDLQTIRQSL